MKQFDLEEYLANPNKKVVTRDGRNVKIHCTNYQWSFPIIAEIEGLDTSMAFNIDGVYGLFPGSNYDLFFAPEKREGWINLYKDVEGNIVTSQVYKTKKSAEASSCRTCIATIKIEWEE